MNEARPLALRLSAVAGPFIGGLLCAVAAVDARAEIYKCVDLDGHTSYLSRPCADLDLLDRVIADNGIYDARRAGRSPRAASDALPVAPVEAVPEPLPALGAGNASPTPSPEPSGDY